MVLYVALEQKLGTDSWRMENQGFGFCAGVKSSLPFATAPDTKFAKEHARLALWFETATYG